MKKIKKMSDDFAAELVESSLEFGLNEDRRINGFRLFSPGAA